MELVIPLARIFGFCRDVPQALVGLQHEIRLTKNTDYNHILHSANGESNAMTLIKHIDLWMPSVLPSPEVRSALEEQMASKAVAKYIFENQTCFVSSSYTSASETWRVTSESHKPTLMLVAFQHDSQYQAQQDAADVINVNADTGPTRAQVSNGGIFSYLADISKVEVRINSQKYPFEDYDVSFLSEQYSRAYVDFLRSGGKWMGMEDPLVSYEEYRRLYPVFAFDLSNASDMFSNIKTNDIEIRWTLNAGGETYRAVCMLMSDRELEVHAAQGRIAIRT